MRIFVITTRPEHAYYYIVIISSRNEDTLHERPMKLHSRTTKTLSREAHPVTDHLGENGRNPAKKQAKSSPLLLF